MQTTEWLSNDWQSKNMIERSKYRALGIWCHRYLTSLYNLYLATVSNGLSIFNHPGKLVASSYLCMNLKSSNLIGQLQPGMVELDILPIKIVIISCMRHLYSHTDILFLMIIIKIRAKDKSSKLAKLKKTLKLAKLKKH